MHQASVGPVTAMAFVLTIGPGQPGKSGGKRKPIASLIERPAFVASSCELR